MPRSYPALVIALRRPNPDVSDLVLAMVDEDRPIAIEEMADGLKVFFATDNARRTAHARLTGSDLDVSVESIDVPDDDWAVRGQPALQPVTVGRLEIVPEEGVRSPAHSIGRSDPLLLFIPPSMGFGTGHHASTRLCLALLQELRLEGRRVLDVGTGSGILAIAASVLGAASALAIDYDVDALTAARENVQRNGVEDGVTLRTFDLDRDDPTVLGTFDIVIANLTGGHLEQRARPIRSCIAPGGQLIASGFQVREADDVRGALEATGLTLARLEEEEGWMAALLVSAIPS